MALIGYQVIIQSILPLSGVRILGYAANISVPEVIRLTNEKRSALGLKPLTENATLSEAARAKVQDMFEDNYWAHVAPDGTQPWKFFADYNYQYRYAGENLARDFSSASSAVEAWMSSPSHRENLLSSKYQEIGVAVLDGDLNGVETTIIVQFFGTKYADTVSEPIAQTSGVITSEEVVIKEDLAPSPTSLPTVIPTMIPTKTQERLVASVEGSNSPVKPPFLLSPFKTTKTLSLLTISLLLTVLVIDGVVTSRRKIPRIGGRTFAHFAFLGMILTIVFIARAGIIL